MTKVRSAKIQAEFSFPILVSGINIRQCNIEITSKKVFQSYFSGGAILTQDLNVISVVLAFQVYVGEFVSDCRT